MTTVKFKGKVYAVVPDGDHACNSCVFRGNMDHACGLEQWEGEPFSDGPAVSCIDGGHHYEELPQ